MTGSAFTLVSPEEEENVRAIERAIARRLPRVTIPDFDYEARAANIEVPHAQRIAEIRRRKAEERQRAQANAARRAESQRTAPRPGWPAHRDPSSPGFRPRRRRRR
jgi:ATP-dependent RNA helicase RhlE